MKVLVVSDTHGHLDNLERAVTAEAPIDLLVHCGDVEGQERSLETIARCPCWIVAGNNDFYGNLPKELTFQIAGNKAFVTHGHTYGIFQGTDRLLAAARSRDCSLAFAGHTHVPMLQNDGSVFFMNPGSLTYPRQSGRKPSYGVLELDREGKIITAEIRYLSK